MKLTKLLLALISTASLALAAEEGFKPLFNGKDLTGWDGNPKLWSVKDGAITGVTGSDPETKINHNTFLVHKDEVSDFELRFTYRIVAGNSGVQYRSKVTGKGAFGPRVGGYQADFEAGTTYSGILYDEGGVAGGRGVMCARGEKVKWTAENKKEVTGKTEKTSAELQATIKKEDWNEYIIVAKGGKITHSINGNVTADITDESPKMVKSGVLALQIHVGPPMTVQFKNVRIKDLK